MTVGRADGLRLRLARIPGETPKGVLSKPLILPAVLGSFGWAEDALHSEYDTIKAGEFSQPALGGAKARRLRKLDDVETLTVDWDPVWLIERGQDPQEVYSQMYAVLRSKKPCAMIATLNFTDRPLLQIDVTIRSITLQLRQGEPDSRYYVLSISEWRRADGRRKGSGAGANRRHGTTAKVSDVTTLYSLAIEFFGSYTAADSIAAANGIKGFGKNDFLWQYGRYKIGSTVKIPSQARGPGGPQGSILNLIGSK